MRPLTIILWATFVPFATLAVIFTLVEWLRPEWHSQSIIAPLSIAIAIIAGGWPLFRTHIALSWRVLSFVGYAIILPLPLLYFGAFFICFFFVCPP